jgi:hypothetical protein
MSWMVFGLCELRPFSQFTVSIYENLIAALDRAGQWLEIPLTLGAVASDNRRYAQVGFPSIGVALGGSGGHTPADVPELVDVEAMQLAADLRLATIWQLAF